MKKYFVSLLAAVFVVEMCGRVSFIVNGESSTVEAAVVDERAQMFSDIIESNASKYTTSVLMAEPAETPEVTMEAVVEQSTESEAVQFTESTASELATEATEKKSTTTKTAKKTTKEATTARSTESTEASEQVTEPASVETGIYKYCPTVINGTMLYCSNEANPGEVKDGIYLNGTRVLSTTAGSWDSVQVCDPSVVSGSFSFNGSGYAYLMAYLGCATYDCTNNEIGFAVSNDLYNWTKVGKIVSCAGDGYWGVGQPSLLSKDGSIFLFYTSGTAQRTTTYVKQLNCDDLNNISEVGVKEITTSSDFISNADFAMADGYLYMTCDTHPFSSGALDFISDKQTIYKAAWDGSLEGLGSLSWSTEATIGSDKTGYTKNHNACFSRDGSGNLIERTVFVTVAGEVGDYSDNLFTYRIMTEGF